MENYEKLYKEALERAKDCCVNKKFSELEDTAQQLCEYVFPELKESEDEKIRKALLEHFGTYHSGSAITNDVVVEDVLTWLEKQGKQKPIIIIPQFKVGDTIKPKSYNEEHLIKDINENGYVLDVDIIIPFKDEDVWEIVAQNPAWSEEDEEMFDAIIADIKFTQKAHNYDVDQVVYEEEIDWLKSIKDRVQSKQEWGEYDKIQLSEAIQMVEANGTWIRSEDAVKKVSNWLKSIKPHWKPSEQNIKDLEWCADLVKDKMGVGFHRLQVFIDEIKNL